MSANKKLFQWLKWPMGIWGQDYFLSLLPAARPAAISNMLIQSPIQTNKHQRWQWAGHRSRITQASQSVHGSKHQNWASGTLKYVRWHRSRRGGPTLSKYLWNPLNISEIFSMKWRIFNLDWWNFCFRSGPISLIFHVFMIFVKALSCHFYQQSLFMQSVFMIPRV